MKKILMRPTAALFPAVLLLAGLVGKNIPVHSLFIYYCMIQLLSLCSVDAFRNAVAREPGVKRVDRRFSGSWLTLLLGIAASFAIGWFFGPLRFNWEKIAILGSAAFIIIEQLFEERMFALSRRTDGVVLSVISNLLLLVGLLLDASGGVSAPVDVRGFYTICGTGLGMVISVITAYAVEPMHAFSLAPRNIGFFPKAAVQSLLYPAIVLGMESTAGIMAGWMIWRLCRTVCRRAGDESRPLNLLLMTAAAAAIIGGLYGLSLNYSIAAFVALICAAIVYCAPGWRFYVGVGLITIAVSVLHTGFEYGQLLKMEYMIFACCAAAVVLNMHKAFLRKV